MAVPLLENSFTTEALVDCNEGFIREMPCTEEKLFLRTDERGAGTLAYGLVS